ncbi:hypothetical protein FRB94_013177 [Tulasnella sp. JGI-2019a]|nr:hypothetical protein FRB94_013177 [Tulasnella sp. JGI-2019a]KAG9038129.1 hypothetical protein FRB95_002569 [Tulasnella sp. JGI-2019a]
MNWAHDTESRRRFKAVYFKPELKLEDTDDEHDETSDQEWEDDADEHEEVERLCRHEEEDGEEDGEEDNIDGFEIDSDHWEDEAEKGEQQSRQKGKDGFGVENDDDQSWDGIESSEPEVAAVQAMFLDQRHVSMQREMAITSWTKTSQASRRSSRVLKMPR